MSPPVSACSLRGFDLDRGSKACRGAAPDTVSAILRTLGRRAPEGPKGEIWAEGCGLCVG